MGDAEAAGQNPAVGEEPEISGTEADAAQGTALQGAPESSQDGGEGIRPDVKYNG